MANEDKAARYHRLHRQASIIGTMTSAALLCTLVVSGASAAIRQALAAVVGESLMLLVAAYVTCLMLLNEGVQLPLSFYRGVTLERRYGLSTQTTGRWWRDEMKAGALGLVFVVLAALLVSALLRASPEHWWLWSAGCFGVVLVGLAQLAPVVLLPLFYDIRPIERPALADRLLSLAERSGARVLGVYEWQLSDRTRKANAALVGIGGTRRILLSDTLLRDHSDDEIEVILAHEIAHHVHRDIWSNIAIQGALITAGFWGADVVLSAVGGSFGLQGKADPAALPLIALTAGAVSLVCLPLVHGLSRAHERRADTYALELTRNDGAFVSAMKRLAAQNLAEEEPSRVVELLFHSHPSTVARIAHARAWAAARRDAHGKS